MQDIKTLQTLSMPIHIDYIVLYAHITYSLKIYLLAQISSNLPKILIFILMLLFKLKLIMTNRTALIMQTLCFKNTNLRKRISS